MNGVGLSDTRPSSLHPNKKLICNEKEQQQALIGITTRSEVLPFFALRKNR
jgi:hypothetical protein